MQENDPPKPSDLTDHIGYWLRMVSNAVSQEFARRMAEQGVTVAEWVFLRALYDSAGTAPTALADQMGMTRGAISKLADRLQAKGLVHCQSSVGRGHILTLTPAARVKLPVLADLADQNDAAFFAELTEGERQGLTRLLQAVAAKRGLSAAPTE